jgi:AcrR family transcriptional regulator
MLYSEGMASANDASASALGEDISRRPGGRVERRKARTRRNLLAAARHLFADRGVEHTAIADIAERADIAIGSFYNYFSTKDELLNALIEDSLSEQLRLLQHRRARVSDPAEKISLAHRHLVRVGRTDPDWAWLLVRLEFPHRVAWAVLGDVARRDLLAGIRAGRFRVTNPTLALNASGGALLAVIHAQLVGELSVNADSEHAEGVLRSFGLDPVEAAVIARRPLPEVGDASAEGMPR